LTNGDQQLAGGLDPDPGQGDQGGRDRGDQRLQLGVELVELGLELLPTAGQGPPGGLGRGRWAGQRPVPQGRARPDQGLGCKSEQWLAQFLGAL
jgi:hypothetical protein